jgi:hypothetical protein
MSVNTRESVERVLDDDVADVLRETFFAPDVPIEMLHDGTGRRRMPVRETATPTKVRPEHYKVICISLYNEDLDRLDQAVRELKRRGNTKASRSSVLRAAMLQLDLDRVPRGI